MDKPICLETEIIWPFRNGIAMAALLSIVLVAALDRGVSVHTLTCSVSLFLAAAGVALGGLVPRMQRPERNDESGDVVAILTFGHTYWGAGCLVFRCVLDDWFVAFEIARTTSFSFMVGASIGVLLLTLVRGTTTELLMDVGFMDPARWQTPEHGELEEWLPPDAQDWGGRNDIACSRTIDVSASPPIQLLWSELGQARGPGEHPIPANRGDGDSRGGSWHFRAPGQKRLRSSEAERTSSARGVARSTGRHSA
jgi:hypothetical protein